MPDASGFNFYLSIFGHAGNPDPGFNVFRALWNEDPGGIQTDFFYQKFNIHPGILCNHLLEVQVISIVKTCWMRRK